MKEAENYKEEPVSYTHLDVYKRQAITKEKLQEWVDYANRTGAVIIYDAAYEAYITETDIPHSIYECNGARTLSLIHI